jgi:peptide/nickel transport system permease protein
LVAVAIVIYGGLRILRPDLYPGEALPSGIVHDLNRALLHFDFGCYPPGGIASGARPSGDCTPLRVVWERGMAADIWLLVGSIVIGVVVGVLAGLWCAGHPRTLRAHVLQTGAAVAICAPVYFVGLAVLYLFNPDFGKLPVPFFFDAVSRWTSPFTDPWSWLRMMVVPWLVLAAPLAGMCLRMTLGQAREIGEEDYIRTAVAKGLPHGRVMRRHVGLPTFGATVSFAPVTLPLFLTNVMLVEMVFSVPGFFYYVWGAIGNNSENAINRPFVVAGAVWRTVLLIILGLVADAILERLDPRVRDAY